MIIRIGYIIASNQIMRDGMAVGYLYREEPDNENDSGWRIFSGEESQEYADDPTNFSMYNYSTIVELESAIKALLVSPYPSSFERDDASGEFVEVSEDAESE